MRELLLALTLLVSTSASAAEVRYLAPSAPVRFEHVQRLANPISFDSGWKPSTGPIQVRFYGNLGSEVRAVAPGAIQLGWGPAPLLWADGASLGGSFGMDVGAEFRSKLRLNLNLPFGKHLTWEGDIPGLYRCDLRFAQTRRFTPFLLEDQVPNQVLIRDSTTDVDIFRVPLTDGFIPIPGVGGYLEFGIGGTVEAILQEGALVFPDQVLRRQDSPLAWKVPADPVWESEARYEALVRRKVDLDLEPSVTVRVGPLKWDLAKFRVGIPTPATEHNWAFGSQKVVVELPRLEVVEPVAVEPVPGQPDPQRIDFGTVAFGSSSQRTIRIVNTGGASLTAALAVTGEGFSATATEPVEVAPGAAAELKVGFEPVGAGTFVGEARLESSDPARPVAVVALAAAADLTESDGLEMPAGEAPQAPEVLPPAPEDPKSAPAAGCSTAAGAPGLGFALLALGLIARRRVNG